VAKARKTAKPDRMVLDLAEMVPADYNPRSMSERAREGLGASMRTFGYVQDLIVNRRLEANGWPAEDNGRFVVVSGHQRLEQLKTDGYDAAEVTWKELTPEQERALNVTMNNPRIAGEFTADVVDLLDGLDLELFEFEELRFDDLLENFDTKPPLTDPPRGPSTDQSGQLQDQFRILVECSDEKHQHELLATFEEEGLTCRAFVL